MQAENGRYRRYFTAILSEKGGIKITENFGWKNIKAMPYSTLSIAVCIQRGSFSTGCTGQASQMPHHIQIMFNFTLHVCGKFSRGEHRCASRCWCSPTRHTNSEHAGTDKVCQPCQMGNLQLSPRHTLNETQQ